MYFIFGDPKVTMVNETYEITNIRTKLLLLDLKKAAGTSRIGNNIFRSITSTKLVIDKFFALELHRCLSKAQDNRNLRSNQRALAILVAALESDTWLSKLNDLDGIPSRLDRRKLNEMTFKPMDHQNTFFDAYDKLPTAMGVNGCMLGSAAGTGKTYMGIALTRMIEHDYVIVISPKNAVERVWGAEFNNLLRRTPSYMLSTQTTEFKGEEYSVWHYEALPKLLAQLSKFRNKRVMVILDESHNLNTADSNRTERFLELCKTLKPSDVIWASGTPLKALGKEAIPLISCIDPSFTRHVQDRYAKMVAGNTSGAELMVAERLELISVKIEKDVIDVNPPSFVSLPIRLKGSERYTLKNVMEEVRVFVEERVRYYAENYDMYRADWEALVAKAASANTALPDSEWVRYRRNVDYIAQMEKTKQLKQISDLIHQVNKFEKREIVPFLQGKDKHDFNDAKSVVKYVSLKVLGEALGRVVGGIRIEAIQRIAEEAPYMDVFNSTTKKVVVFSYYVSAIEAAEQKCLDLGLTPVTVYGKNTSELPERVRSFMEDEEINPIIATFDSLSTAVPLTAADTMLLLNPPFRDYELQQAVSRISRLNGSKDTFVYTAMLDTGDEPNITTRSLDILKWSQEQVERLLRIESPYKIESGSEAQLADEPSMDTVRGLMPTLPTVFGNIVQAASRWL